MTDDGRTHSSGDGCQPHREPLADVIARVERQIEQGRYDSVTQQMNVADLDYFIPATKVALADVQRLLDAARAALVERNRHVDPVCEPSVCPFVAAIDGTTEEEA